MKEIGGRARARQGGGDLPSNEAGLPHPGDDDASGAGMQELHGLHEARVEARAEAENALGFEPQHPLGQGEDALRVHHAPRSPAVIAAISSSSSGRSTSRSMLGPSDSGRPSGIVRSGSS